MAAPMTKAPSRPPIRMSDVARAAGVSPMSVSNAFNRPAVLLPETRARILAVAAELGYVPNRIAGTLASGRSQVVAAIVPSIRNSSFARTVQGLSDTLTDRGYELLLAIADTPERELSSLQAVLGRRPDGIVLTGNAHLPQSIALLRQARLPVVESWILSAPIIDMAVGFDLGAAAFAMGRHLIARGYRHIGYAGYAPAENSRFLERQQGFQRALRGAGLRDDLLFHAEERSGFKGGRLALETLRMREPRLDAIFCSTDVFAAGLIFECQRRGIQVPEDLAVAGYGDFEIAAEIVPRLSTVRTRGYEIGQGAARLILDRAEGREASARYDVGHELVLRESS
jgi:LacI family gluconate utilization system Gnt-I transcriptional repressor